MTPRLPPLTVTGWLRFDAIRSALSVVEGSRVLEVGAGEGGLGSWLAQRFTYVAVEPDDASRSVATRRVGGSGRVVERLDDDVEAGFDLVCAFEVLEHIGDDGAALREWVDRLRVGGWVLLSVPAHPERFSAADRLVGHERRYDRRSLERFARSAELTVIRCETYGAGLGHLLEAIRDVWARRLVVATSNPERTAASGRLVQPKSRLWALTNWAVALPFRALQRPLVKTDCGIGYVMLAQRAA